MQAYRGVVRHRRKAQIAAHLPSKSRYQHPHRCGGPDPHEQKQRDVIDPSRTVKAISTRGSSRACRAVLELLGPSTAHDDAPISGMCPAQTRGAMGSVKVSPAFLADLLHVPGLTVSIRENYDVGWL